jgi:glycosyltransferase involved in cell wall biosynthesis
MNNGSINTGPVKVSVCIPAYKQKELLARCLDSLLLQGFKDFEVIITDDTPDDSIADFVKGFKSDFPLHYYRNVIPLGSPANWNMAT